MQHSALKNSHDAVRRALVRRTLVGLLRRRNIIRVKSMMILKRTTLELLHRQ